MSYTAKDIRNIALLGHGGDGKTMLAEDMLYLTKGSDRLGSIADGNTVSDFDPEEIKRQNSISASLIPVEFDKTKINVLDNPGVFDFAGEIVQSLRVADAGLIVLSAKSGIAVGTEKAWKSMSDAGKPTMFYVSKMDEDHANYYKVVDDLRDKIRLNHIIRLQKSECTIEHGFVLSDILTNFERVSDHCSNIGGCVIEIAKYDALDMHQYNKKNHSSEDFEQMYKKYSSEYSI